MLNVKKVKSPIKRPSTSQEITTATSPMDTLLDSSMSLSITESDCYTDNSQIISPTWKMTNQTFDSNSEAFDSFVNYPQEKLKANRHVEQQIYGETLSTEESAAISARSFAKSTSDLNLPQLIASIQQNDITKLGKLRNPDNSVKLVGISMLVLFSEVDKEISLVKNYKVLMTRAWDQVIDWTKRLSRAYYFIKQLVDILQKGTITAKVLDELRIIQSKLQGHKFAGVVDKFWNILCLVVKTSPTLVPYTPVRLRTARSVPRLRNATPIIQTIPKPSQDINEIMNEIQSSRHHIKHMISEQKRREWDDMRKYKERQAELEKARELKERKYALTQRKKERQIQESKKIRIKMDLSQRRKEIINDQKVVKEV